MSVWSNLQRATMLPILLCHPDLLYRVVGFNSDDYHFLQIFKTSLSRLPSSAMWYPARLASIKSIPRMTHLRTSGVSLSVSVLDFGDALVILCLSLLTLKHVRVRRVWLPSRTELHTWQANVICEDSNRVQCTEAVYEFSISVLLLSRWRIS